MTDTTNERYSVLVNGHAVEPGCWVEGHWGQYGPDHLADRAGELGWEPAAERDDPRWWRGIADALEQEIVPDGCPPGIDASSAWENHIESADDIETWLNKNTAPVCPHCGDPMYATSDGFYRHLNFPALVDDGPCEFRAIDEPIYYRWGWHDGEFYLWPTETWEEDA